MDSDGETGADGAEDEVDDDLYQEAVRVVCEMGRASTSTLQRRLRIGYGRAARLIDIMEKDGIVGPPDGTKAARSAEEKRLDARIRRIREITAGGVARTIVAAPRGLAFLCASLRSFPLRPLR